MKEDIISNELDWNSSNEHPILNKDFYVYLNDGTVCKYNTDIDWGNVRSWIYEEDTKTK